MPRTRFDKLAAPKRDPIKATFLERKDATDTSLEAMASALGASVAPCPVCSPSIPTLGRSAR